MIALRIPVLIAVVSLHIACSSGEVEPVRGDPSEAKNSRIQVYGDSLVESDKLLAIGRKGRPHIRPVDTEPNPAYSKDTRAREKHACVPDNPRYLAEFERFCNQSARHCELRARLRYRTQACP